MQNVHKIKQDMCDIGRRIYNRQFAAANDGNITVRVSENEVLCTPTLHCKGFLTPDDIATIDMTGKQIAGRKKRSSEALLHLEIYKQRDDIKSVVHCHPPHATAFAIAREPIPQCILPEVEVFLGDVPITKYETPGGQAFADTIIPFVSKTNVMILANHGTVSYGETVEQAYWWTEILDSYCRMLMLAKQLGNVSFLDQQKSQELLDLKDQWGYKDPRNTKEYEDCDICANDIFRTSWKDSGVERRAFDAPPAMPAQKPAAAPAAASGVSEEQLVKLITDEVMRQMKA
ncbi:class II aldolase/adducin family protein [Roseiconus lacunae]|uniref:Class II aldolase/adducin family protein n=1 Tax=Roseiconus lacunae TaxID=2605694 RepID=A0ABT7PSN1_9BACT|nr:class II aldolase/adducin family protein [Roseiconus lacunae]MCD0462596.1 class II aldolase/adducin family protein [Roseiconus lacunae]MDM4019141.1 class II aldolase/adducin family protein [Roseiconus lacunae]WRQ48995.1 class II aldolase/adducin family protein [Stieleria sp. HD01]